MDITTKYIFGGLLVKALIAAGYFEGNPENIENESTVQKGGGGVVTEQQVLICRLITHFMECMQFNSHMIDSVYLNRIIAPDSETRMWKDAKRYCRRFSYHKFCQSAIGG